MSFNEDGDETSPCPVRVLCNKVLQNSSMAPFNLKCHFETKNSEHKAKPPSLPYVC